MSDIFISYARADLDAARRLAGALERQGWSVFWDRTIPAGRTWRDVVGAALVDARCVVVLWSQHSVSSDWVLDEADHGLKRRALIPALIEGVEPPLGFGSIQAVDLSSWRGNYDDAAIEQFLSAVAGVLGPAPVVPGEVRLKAEAQHRADEQQRRQAEAGAKRRAEKGAKRKAAEQRRQLVDAEATAQREAEEERARVEARYKTDEKRQRLEVATRQAKPISLFYSYSHKDEDFRIRLETHLAVLRRGGLIAEWHDRKIEAGDAWKDQIDRHLTSADIVLLLVSADFIASDYCWGEEMTKALARHERGEARVIPVILRHCHWQSTPLATLQAVPRDAKPIKSWADEDEAFDDVVAAIERAVQTARQKATAPSSD